MGISLLHGLAQPLLGFRIVLCGAGAKVKHLPEGILANCIALLRWSCPRFPWPSR